MLQPAMVKPAIAGSSIAMEGPLNFCRGETRKELEAVRLFAQYADDIFIHRTADASLFIDLTKRQEFKFKD